MKLVEINDFDVELKLFPSWSCWQGHMQGDLLWGSFHIGCWLE